MHDSEWAMPPLEGRSDLESVFTQILFRGNLIMLLAI